MGFFDDVFKTVTQVAKAVVTGGVSLIAPKLIPGPLNTIIDTITGLQFPSSVGQVGATAALVAGVSPAALAALPAGSTFLAGSKVFLGPGHGQPSPQGAQPMALDLGNLLGAVGSVFSGSTIGNFATAASQFIPQPVSYTALPVAQVQSSQLPVVVAGRNQLTKEIFDAGAKVLARLGVPLRTVTASTVTSALKRALGSIASLARRTPSGTIVSLLVGLGLTAYEANLLTAWHAQRRPGRRMNPANSKALRRAARRIKSFHKLCVHVDVLKSRGRRKPCK